MPKRLSDITHAYERTAADLERTEYDLAQTTERDKARVKAAEEAHFQVADELRAYLRDHPDEVIIANDFGYHWSEAGFIVRRPIFWAHHVWVEDPAPPPVPATYRVPTISALATAWGEIEPNGEVVE